VYAVFSLYSPYHSLSSPPPPPLLPSSPQTELFNPPVSNFIKEKNHIFVIVTQGVSLWHFHKYMY
jgi:hypothetical protein